MFLIKADVTQKDVNGKTVEWPDRTDYGLNDGRNSTQRIGTEVDGKTNYGYNDVDYSVNMIEFLKKYPWSVVNFKGFASPQGNPNSNTKLAEERAKLLREKLITDWGTQLGVTKDILEKRFKILDPVALTAADTPDCAVETTENPNPPVDVVACKLARRVEISVTFDSTLKAEQEKSLLPKPPLNTGENIRVRTEITNKFYTECDYFERMINDYEEVDENGNVTVIPGNKFVFDAIREKIRYFHPAFHSTTPEGLNSRLTFLLQCTRQGPTLEKQGANNLAFGRPPICILRIGDFYNTKIAIDNVSISYEPLVWDLNPEGIGVQPMIANVDLSFSFLGGSSLMGPINKLQNALSFNYFANTHVYDPRADYIAKSEQQKGNKDKLDNTIIDYNIIDGNKSYLSNIEQKITEEILPPEDLVIDQISDEEFVNGGIENITEEPTNTGTTFIIITNMTCDQSSIVKTDSEWLLPIKLTYLPALDGGAQEAVEKLESGYGNYKIKVKDVNSNETYENFMTKDKFVKFFTLNDFSNEGKFVVPIKGEGISDAEQGIKDNIFKENFYVSLVKDGNELYKVNIKL